MAFLMIEITAPTIRPKAPSTRTQMAVVIKRMTSSAGSSFHSFYITSTGTSLHELVTRIAAMHGSGVYTNTGINTTTTSRTVSALMN
jgi:hypothetical protein